MLFTDANKKQTKIAADAIATNPEFSFVEGGLFHTFLMKLGLADPGRAGLRARLICLISITFLPLLLLCALQGVAYNPAIKIPFLYDLCEWSRFVVVGPLLILSEVVVEPWLVQVVRYTKERLIMPEDKSKFEHILADTVRLHNLSVAEILLFVGTFLWQWLDMHTIVRGTASDWQILPNGNPSFAWYWYAYFAKPLIRFLWLRWVWRYLTWALLLCRTATLNLKITPTHPDGLGGLLFMTVGHSRFCVLAFALGAQAAGVLGRQILFEGRSLISCKYELIAVVLVVLILFLTPLLAFTTRLFEAKRTGLFEYGALADQYVSLFRKKWVGNEDCQSELLGSSDIQSMADMGNSYELVRRMKCCLVDKTVVLTFVAATLLPLCPLAFTIYPLDELLKNVLKVMI